jgi:hypothetical protein
MLQNRGSWLIDLETPYSINLAKYLNLAGKGVKGTGRARRWLVTVSPNQSTGMAWRTLILAPALTLPHDSTAPLSPCFRIDSDTKEHYWYYLGGVPRFETCFVTALHDMESLFILIALCFERTIVVPNFRRDFFFSIDLVIVLMSKLSVEV